MKDSAGDLALHRSLWDCTANLQWLSFYLDEYPDAIQEVSNDGELPLHIEARVYCDYEFLELLIDRFPVGLSIPNKRGRVPLFCAIQTSFASIESLDLLYERYPKGLAARDVSGNTSLDQACRRRNSTETMKGIVEKCPASVQTINDLETFQCTMRHPNLTI